jgi:hypothetical protein
MAAAFSSALAAAFAAFPMQMQVRCRVKHSTMERITHIGGVYDDGRRWKYTEAEAIAMMDAGTHKFYTFEGGARVEVEIMRDSFAPFLKTIPDNRLPNNLLSLPTCP